MTGKTNNPIFGCDPELFASYVHEGENYVLPPVIFRDDMGVPFEENGRHPIFARYGGTIVHEDGAAFEMSTPPSANWETMWDAINEAKINFSKEVLSRYDLCDGKLHSIPAMKYDPERWKDRGPEFEMAVQFGCDPDMDAFNMQAQCPIIDASQHRWRYAGGHIHASGIKRIETEPLLAIQSMILSVGLAATAYSDVPELESERIFLYGKPGKFRVQRYPSGEVGIEYRTPSTRWTHDKELARKVFEWATIGLTSIFQGGLLDQLKRDIMTDARDVILSVNQAEAHNLLKYIEAKL